ncbi:unnamed protein product [Laminaria digitata]
MITPPPPPPLLISVVVPQIMDLCLLRNDPTGSLRYSQEEGLPKSTIERLPQTRYKKPPTAKAAKGGKGNNNKPKHGETAGGGGAAVGDSDADSVEGGMGAGMAGSVPGPDGPRTAAVAGAGVGDERDSTADMCAICLVEYETSDELRVIPGCQHHFHKDCIDPWLETKAVCAYCKAKVEARKSCCDRALSSLSARVGLNLVAPTTIRFSSSRRTYTNEDVRELLIEG